MITRTALTLAIAAAIYAAPATAEEPAEAPQITLGNGEANSIQVEGLSAEESAAVFSEVRVDGAAVSTRRANSTTLTFPEVVIAQNGWLVLHPVMDGRPNGDVVSGFAYLTEGANENVALPLDHPAKSGDRFLVMLHGDVDQDRVFDFVFVEGGHVEDKAVFEGDKMIAHIIAVP
ncbi:MAG: hypothetical protein AAFX03_02540 [Pseudomonadota bacterium]